MKPFSVYLTEEVGSVESYLKEFGDAVASTHERFDEKGHTFFIPLKFDRSLPNKMIMAALQGDEPAGWTGLLNFVKSENPKTSKTFWTGIEALVLLSDHGGTLKFLPALSASGLRWPR